MTTPNPAASPSAATEDGEGDQQQGGRTALSIVTDPASVGPSSSSANFDNDDGDAIANGNDTAGHDGSIGAGSEGKDMQLDITIDTSRATRETQQAPTGFTLSLSSSSNPLDEADLLSSAKGVAIDRTEKLEDEEDDGPMAILPTPSPSTVSTSITTTSSSVGEASHTTSSLSGSLHTFSFTGSGDAPPLAGSTTAATTTQASGAAQPPRSPAVSIASSSAASSSSPQTGFIYPIRSAVSISKPKGTAASSASAASSSSSPHHRPRSAHLGSSARAGAGAGKGNRYSYHAPSSSSSSLGIGGATGALGLMTTSPSSPTASSSTSSSSSSLFPPHGHSSTTFGEGDGPRRIHRTIASQNTQQQQQHTRSQSCQIPPSTSTSARSPPRALGGAATAGTSTARSSSGTGTIEFLSPGGTSHHHSHSHNHQSRAAMLPPSVAATVVGGQHEFSSSSSSSSSTGTRLRRAQTSSSLTPRQPGLQQGDVVKRRDFAPVPSLHEVAESSTAPAAAAVAQTTEDAMMRLRNVSSSPSFSFASLAQRSPSLRKSLYGGSSSSSSNSSGGKGRGRKVGDGNGNGGNGALSQRTGYFDHVPVPDLMSNDGGIGGAEGISQNGDVDAAIAVAGSPLLGSPSSPRKLENQAIDPASAAPGVLASPLALGPSLDNSPIPSSLVLKDVRSWAANASTIADAPPTTASTTSGSTSSSLPAMAAKAQIPGASPHVDTGVAAGPQGQGASVGFANDLDVNMHVSMSRDPSAHGQVDDAGRLYEEDMCEDDEEEDGIAAGAGLAGLPTHESPGEEEKKRLDLLHTTRFKHVETPEGHMVVNGMDGQLVHCEDEPIHIPGAVQSFGCMVVVREDEEGALVVRQASENTGDIIGLTPSYLFSLPSFLDCLDEDQADALWDNIEALDESDQDLAESGPHIFRLDGWGQPGDGTGKARARKFWRCWCAVHRPTSQILEPGERPLTVMEFELVEDGLNPLQTLSPAPSPAPTIAELSGTPPSWLSDRRRSSAATARTAGSNGAISASQNSDSTGKTEKGAWSSERGGLEGQPYVPTLSQFRESTESASKPLKALARIRRAAAGSGGDAGDAGAAGGQRRPRRRRAGANGPGFGLAGAAAETQGTLDMFGILSQANEQLSAQTDLQSFLKVVVGIIREITTFSRVMVYQFDEQWNGQVVCELVDWNDTHDLYRGLTFPATDIPSQARFLYKINKVRLLYDRDQPTARMVCRSQDDLKSPIDMTHAFLRAMSPIHIKYLANMGVRASMSISIVAFDQLWGLIALHNYGEHGKRVAFPVRQLCRLLGESISRNIERLSYTRRLGARRLINTFPTDENPSGYIISNAEDLLALFDADFGVISIGHEAKILGPLDASQEVLGVTEYLRLKRFQSVLTSTDVGKDFPDMILPNGLEIIAGLLLVPLSGSGVDFICFLRKAQIKHVNWAGKPFKEGQEGQASLEPRKSFKVWSEIISGTSRSWKDEELETAQVLCLVYGKFISVWRQREQAVQYNQLNRLLLSNASHEVRTPLNHIINYLELALDSQLDADTREHLSKSHMASKSLLFVINDLLDLTRQEQGNTLLHHEPFDIAATVREAVEMHESEAQRRKIQFSVSTEPDSYMVLGDKNRVRQIIVNTVSNSIKYTSEGEIQVELRKRTSPEFKELPEGCDVEFEILVADTGEGIPKVKLEAIFREFEQVESLIADPQGNQSEPSTSSAKDPSSPTDTKGSGILGLGLAVVARIVKNLGGQLRVDSTVGKGSRFAYSLPFQSATKAGSNTSSHAMQRNLSAHSGSITSSVSGAKSEIDSLVEAISAPILDESASSSRARIVSTDSPRANFPPPQVRPMVDRWSSKEGEVQLEGSGVPLRSVRVEPQDVNPAQPSAHTAGGDQSMSTAPDSIDLSAAKALPLQQVPAKVSPPGAKGRSKSNAAGTPRISVPPLRVLIVEDDLVNRMILKKRLTMDGHSVVQAVNGRQGVESFEKMGQTLDVILMDLQMPILNGQEACIEIRKLERAGARQDRPATHVLNGRIPIFAVSATLTESMREEMEDIGMDGWILKPIDFSRLSSLLKGLTHLSNRDEDQYGPGYTWERGGWLSKAAERPL